MPAPKSKINQRQLVQVYRQALVKGLSLSLIDQRVSHLVKRNEVTEKIEEQAEKKRLSSFFNRVPKIMRIGAFLVPIIFILVGLGLIGSAVVPIFGYYIDTLPNLRSTQLVAPIPQDKIFDVNPLVINQVATSGGSRANRENSAADSEADGPIMLDTKLDFTNLSNWFGDQPISVDGQQEANSELTEFTLDIPKLNIKNAKVKVGGDDLNKSLIQYPGTALPGQAGSPVVFGHSVLRQFYNPKETNPRRYTSIFSTIMTLSKGDKIYLTANNIRYTYMVQEKTEVKPSDTYILAQREDVRQLKLVTCVPEGTYLRRGVVTAQLVLD